MPPLWLDYISERRTTFAKACWIKMRCYGEHVGEHIENLGNILGTCWNPLRTSREHIVNQGKMKKKIPPQNRRFYGKINYLSLWPTYIGEKGRTWAKYMGLK
jgi:hypothetical protein